MGGRITQVVHLAKVEVHLAPYYIRPVIGPFRALLIHQLTELGGSVVVGLNSR